MKESVQEKGEKKKEKKKIHSVASTNVGDFLRGLQENKSNSLKPH